MEKALFNELSKFAGCKINIHKYAAFLYSNNKLSEGEIKKIISLTIPLKNKIAGNKSN